MMSVRPASQKRWVPELATPLPMQLPANGLETQQKMAQLVGPFAVHIGILDEVTVSQL